MKGSLAPRSIAVVGASRAAACWRTSAPPASWAASCRSSGGRWEQGALTLWSGQVSDQVVANWHVEGRRIPCAPFQVLRLEYDATAPF